MDILVDTHTHTNCSTHAFGTVWENMKMAKERNLEAVCMTDHAPDLPDAPHIWRFETMFELPDEIEGVRLIKGIEANIIDADGGLDVPLWLQKKVQMMIASMHRWCYAPSTKDEHTKAWLNVVKNPYVTILGHSGQPQYEFDHEAVVEAAKQYNKCIEINNHSFFVREESAETCKKIALCCKKTGTNIVVSSDAHNPFQVGVFDRALAMLKEIEFPQEQIVNLNAERFMRYLKETGN